MRAGDRTTSTAVPNFRDDLEDWAFGLAMEFEARRREVTLIGSLLAIPGTMLVVLLVMALFGAQGLLLLLSAVAGLTIGPAVCLGFLGASYTFVRPALYGVFRRRLLSAGVHEGEARRLYKLAEERLDRVDMQKTRRRLPRLEADDGLVLP